MKHGAERLSSSYEIKCGKLYRNMNLNFFYDFGPLVRSSATCVSNCKMKLKETY